MQYKQDTGNCNCFIVMRLHILHNNSFPLHHNLIIHPIATSYHKRNENMEKGETIPYQPNETIKPEVRLEEESVCLKDRHLTKNVYLCAY